MNNSSAQLSWEETKSIVSEVEELFKLEQDLPVIREVRKLTNELQELLKNREQSAMDAINALTEQVNQKESELEKAVPLSSKRHQSTLSELEREKQIIEMNINSMKDMNDNKEKSIKFYEEELENVNQQILELKENRIDEVPSLKNTLSLLCAGTGIKWIFDEIDSHPYLLQGYATIDETQTVKRINVDCRDHTPYDLANHLWDLIDPAN